MQCNIDDLKFLWNIQVDGARPRMFPMQAMAQWDIPGFNFNDRCFQAVLTGKEGSFREVTIQVLRRPSSGGSNSEYAWVPLDKIPFTRTRDTHNKILRTIKRWGGFNESKKGGAFRAWLENRD